MPILKENKERYPKDWKQISERIRFERAKNRCEICRVKNYEYVFRGVLDNGTDVFQYSNGNIHRSSDGLKLANDFQLFVHDYNSDKPKEAIKIILTVAHLDHNPENCDDSNLKAMCQKCHNNYDKEHRKETRKKSKKQIELF